MQQTLHGARPCGQVMDSEAMTDSANNSSRSASATVPVIALTADGLPVEGITLVLPVYNEARGLASLLDSLHAALQATGVPFEIVAVDDGSTDGSGGLLRGRTDVRLLEHPVNRGYGAALKTGIRHARYSVIVITDADG